MKLSKECLKIILSSPGANARDQLCCQEEQQEVVDISQVPPGPPARIGTIFHRLLNKQLSKHLPIALAPAVKEYPSETTNHTSFTSLSRI